MAVLTGCAAVGLVASEACPPYLLGLAAAGIVAFSGPAIIVPLLLQGTRDERLLGVLFISFCYAEWAAIWAWGHHRIKQGLDVPRRLVVAWVLVSAVAACLAALLATSLLR
jgi:hypothetical protein